MKKVLLAVLAVALVSSTSFAQMLKKPPVKTTPSAAAHKAAAVESKVAVGKVQSVTLADAAKATKPELKLVTEAGKAYSFLVTLTTTLYDAKTGATTLDKIKAGDKVRVKYIVLKDGMNAASSIHLMP